MGTTSFLDIAARFSDTLGLYPFPRDVESIAIAASLPVIFKALPNLTVESVEAWIARRHGAFRFLCRNRALKGCIVALRGRAVIFTDANDSDAERRHTQAHELAHFLLDYDEPRQRALVALGEVIRPVLDGDRRPTSVERIHATLADVKIGPYHDLMVRDDAGQIVEAKVQFAETRADQFALQFLAPIETLINHLPQSPNEMEPAAFCHDAVEVLTAIFGLPNTVADEYARRLWTRMSRPCSRTWLGL